jgi:hypothetical protein
MVVVVKVELQALVLLAQLELLRLLVELAGHRFLAVVALALESEQEGRQQEVLEVFMGLEAQEAQEQVVTVRHSIPVQIPAALAQRV